MPFDLRASVLSLSLLAVPLAGVGITLEDYVDPNSEWEEAFVVGQFAANNRNFNAELANQSQSQAAIDSGSVLPRSDFQSSYSLTINADYRRVFSTLPLVWSIEGNATGTLSRGTDNGAGSADNITSSAVGRYDSYRDRNPNQFWFAGGEFRDETPGADAFAFVQAGVGYGRVINATALARAIRMVSVLQEYRLLTIYPSDVVLLHLAQTINREAEYRARLGEDGFREAWYDDIEETLLGAGLIDGQGLGALGVIKIDEVLSRENINTREHGFVTRLGVGYLVSDPGGDEGDAAVNLNFRYAKPFGNRGQLIEDASFSRSLERGGQGSFRNQLSYTYEISDVVDWVNNWSHVRQQSDTSDTLTSGFIYDISNTFELDLSVSVSRSDEDAVSGVKGRLNTALRYRLR
ncbi:MAG: hypothetical protein AAF460_17750 [Pseudomonadota bacterium]